jgi:hypothetical protein
MGQYDGIIASYLEKQDKLRARLTTLETIAKGANGSSATLAARQRIEREIRDLDGAIKRCRKKEDGARHGDALPASVQWPGALPARDGRKSSAAAADGPMGQLIFHCPQANRVIATGVQVHPDTFASLASRRAMRCRFCGGEHPWDIVDRTPEVAAILSVRAEDFLGRSVQSDAYAAQAKDPAIRALYERMARQWFVLAVEQETRADALQQS